MEPLTEEEWGIAERASEKPLEELTQEEEETILDVALYISARKERDRRVARMAKRLRKD